MRLCPLLLCLVFLTGCANYEYDLVEPAGLALHVGQQQVRIDVPPLQYRLQTYESRLVLEIYNPTPADVQLLGERSAVVDPSGQSHPLANAAIPPNSYLKLILPPLRPQVYNSGPTIGIGFGAVYGSRDGWYDRSGFIAPYGAYYDEPRYLAVYDPGNPYYWEWNGETNVRLTLVFQQGDQPPFQQRFTFHRKKM